MESSGKQPPTEYIDTLDELIEKGLLPERVKHYMGNFYKDLGVELSQIHSDVVVDELIPQIETKMLEYFNHEETKQREFCTDTANMKLLAAATVVTVRENEIPITTSEIVELLNQNTNIETVVDRFGDEICVEVHGTSNSSVLFNVSDRTRVYVFRCVNENGGSISYDETQSIIGGESSCDPSIVQKIVDRAQSPTISESGVNTIKKKIDVLNGAFTAAVDAGIFIERYVDVLGIHPDTETIAFEIVEEYADDMTNRHPSTIAAAVLWMAITETGEPITQQLLLEESGVTGAGLRKVISETDRDTTQRRYNKLTNSATPGAVIKVPKGVLEWVGEENKYIKYPTGIDGLEPGETLQLEITENVTDDSKIYTPNKTSMDSEGMWCSVDRIPLPKQRNVRNKLPKTVRWGCNDESKNTISLTAVN